MIKKGFSYIGVFFLYFLSLLPLFVLYFFAAILYYPLYYVIGYRKQVTRENLINAFPEKNIDEIKRIEKQFFKYLCVLIFEIIKMSTISEVEIKKRFKFKNLDKIEDYFKRGESVLGCSGHYCNWEWGIVALGLYLTTPNYVIYKPLHNKIYDRWFYKMRAHYGNILVSMRQTLRALAATKNTATIFCFANDQTPVKDEIRYWVNFLNQPTAVLLGVEKIAIQTNRPIFYFKTSRIKKGYYEVDCVPICLHPKETSEHEITNAHFKFLEQIIKEEPAYWLWSHRRWKHKPQSV